MGVAPWCSRVRARIRILEGVCGSPELVVHRAELLKGQHLRLGLGLDRCLGLGLGEFECFSGIEYCYGLV